MSLGDICQWHIDATADMSLGYREDICHRYVDVCCWYICHWYIDVCHWYVDMQIYVIWLWSRYMSSVYTCMSMVYRYMSSVYRYMSLVYRYVDICHGV